MGPIGSAFTGRFGGRNCSLVNVWPQIPQPHCTCGIGSVLEERCGCHIFDSSP